jgi:hypothetical protein
VPEKIRAGMRPRILPLSVESWARVSKPKNSCFSFLLFYGFFASWGGWVCFYKKANVHFAMMVHPGGIRHGKTGME